MSAFVTPPKIKKSNKSPSVSPRKSATETAKTKTKTNRSKRSKRSKINSIKIRRYPHPKDVIFGINNSTGKMNVRRKNVYTNKNHKSVGDNPARYNSNNEFVPQSKISIIMEQYNGLTPEEKNQIQKDFDRYVNGTSPDTHSTSIDNIFDKVSVFKPVDRNNPFSKDDMLFITFLQEKYHGLDNVPKELHDILLDKDKGQKMIDEILDSEEYKAFYSKYKPVYDQEYVVERLRKLHSNSRGGTKINKKQKRRTSKKRQ